MKLLSQEPIGVDLFDGGAQRRLAEQIVSELITPSEFCDASGRIREYSAVLALEGAWGTGKSNVLKMVEETIRHKTHNITLVRYDVWEHRQELTRKSILEKIVEDLTSTTYGLLPKSYREKLYLLTGESVLNYVETTDRCQWIVGILVSALVFVSICKIELLKSPWYLSSALGVTIIGSVLYDFFYLKTGFLGAVGRLLMAFRMKAPVQYQRRYMHKRDATVSDFRAFIHEISAELGRTRKNKNPSRLVIAFDNLDRLSDNEIRDFWASIHVLFAEEKSNRPSNIQIIISYDRYRIRKAFGSCGDGDETIRKTVDLVYNLPDVILSDWAVFLGAKINEVLANVARVTSDDIDQTVKIFNWLHTVEDLAPRAIISFVNALAVQYAVIDKNATSDKDKIPLPYVALYILGWSRRKEAKGLNAEPSHCLKSKRQGGRQEVLTAKVINEELTCFDEKALMLDWHSNDQLIISGAFLKEKSEAAWRWYIGLPGESSIYMAAVVYQLPISRAKEVLSYQRLGLALDSGESDYVRKAYSEDGFHKVFSVIIRQVRNFEYVASALEGINGSDAQAYWDEFYETRRDEIVNAHGRNPIVSNGESALLRHISNWEDLYGRLFSALSMNNDVRDFDLQVRFARSVEDELEKIGRTLVGRLKCAPMEPNEYLSMAFAAREYLPLMNCTCDTAKLEPYAIKEVKNGNHLSCVGLKYIDKNLLTRMPKLRAALISMRSECGLVSEKRDKIEAILERYH